MAFTAKSPTANGDVFFAFALLGVLTAPVSAQADQQARQFDQSSCFTPIDGDRWNACR